MTSVKVGDQVVADLSGGDMGAYSEYVVTDAVMCARKPESVSFEQASCVPVAATTAVFGLRDVKEGQKVLINGASGGVGMYAFQIAKAKGAIVTG